MILKSKFNVTPKMDELAKKRKFLDGLQKWVVDTLVSFPKLYEDVPRIIKIAKKIEVRGLCKETMWLPTTN